MRRGILCLLALLLFLSAGCVRANREGAGYQAYFLSEEVERNPVLVPETRTLPSDTDPVEGLLSVLLEGPESEELVSPLPAGLVLRSWRLEDGLLIVDFSARYAALSGVALTLADYSVTNTLCQLDQVEAVEITAEGDYLTYRDHQRLTAEDTWSPEMEEAPEEEPAD